MSAPTLGARRARRAAAARLLEALDAHASWRWEDLERVPDWGLLEPDARRRLQCLAGAVRFLPSLVRCIDGRRLLAVRDALGPLAFERLLAAGAAFGADALGAATREAAARDFDALADADADAVAKALSQGGAAVLLGTLDPALRRAAFIPLVGPTRSDVVAADDAAAIVAVATRLAGEDGGTDRPSPAAATDMTGTPDASAGSGSEGSPEESGATHGPDASATPDVVDAPDRGDTIDTPDPTETDDADVPAGSTEGVAA